MSPTLIGTAEAARRLRINRSTLSRRVQLGHITPVVRMPGTTGALLFDAADVDRLAANTNGDEPAEATA